LRGGAFCYSTRDDASGIAAVIDGICCSEAVRLVDILSETPDGNMTLDLRNFHEVVPIA
jgi:hypothetical protein